MIRINWLYLSMALLVLIIFIVLIVLFIKKVKLGWLWLTLTLLIIVGGMYIRHRIIHRIFYDFQSSVCKEFPGVTSIKLDYSKGGQCSLCVNVRKDSIEYNEVESIFISILKKINQEPLSSYLKRNPGIEHNNWSELIIYFTSRRWGETKWLYEFETHYYGSSKWFTEEQKQEQNWKESNTSKEYRYIDYAEE